MVFKKFLELFFYKLQTLCHFAQQSDYVLLVKPGFAMPDLKRKGINWSEIPQTKKNHNFSLKIFYKAPRNIRVNELNESNNLLLNSLPLSHCNI